MDIFLIILFAIAMFSIIRIEKKMDNILNLMQGKPIDYKEEKKKKDDEKK
ncbi:MAG: hypothetical protein J6Q13_01830 [Clostridia bacterium]|nr:hypothetical protein [Clostridia bacterium]